MKILIFLFAMITFILMTSDPRRDEFERGHSTAQDEKKSDHLQYDQDRKDSDEAI